MNWRKIFVISIIAICVISINLAVFFTIIEKEDRSELPEKETIIDTVALEENFQNIFDNTLNTQGNSITINKSEADKEIVYTRYQNKDSKEKKYSFSISIPKINIQHSEANKINEEINNIFYNKVNDILLSQSDMEIIYSVDYKAYINDNILSLVIRSNLKEGSSAQRLIVKTYNYNLSSNELLTIDKALEYRSLNSKAIQTSINHMIENAENNASAFQKLGYQQYNRNKESDMYLIENTKVFFLGEDKALYIIYPYGNSNYTSELDLLVV